MIAEVDNARKRRVFIAPKKNEQDCARQTRKIEISKQEFVIEESYVVYKMVYLVIASSSKAMLVPSRTLTSLQTTWKSSAS